ncbi:MULTISPECIES: hypothetical protein [unclassified Streptomyces]|uniref:hypothetical protein n=1 Tax=unclassified Streptomyces TaxID=2593676 RepID=UPI0023651A20|nr:MULTISPECIES: hypothetical protein [unclassified Streptomyces]MDF3142147.1 hypothetical protein [Streptomyces sp. T21Q-yed]WDF43572.1 hypothetical protein PBV52_45750 [Streptomyces sp. T12]
MPRYLFSVVAAVVACAIYGWGSQSVVVSVVVGVVTAYAAAFVRGMAQAAYDERHGQNRQT